MRALHGNPKTIGFRTIFGGGLRNAQKLFGKGSKTTRNGLGKPGKGSATVWENGLEKAQKRAPKRTWKIKCHPCHSFLTQPRVAQAGLFSVRISWWRGGDSERA